MHGTLRRQKLIEFGRLLDELKRRRERKLHKRRGWYDDNGVRQGGLIAFVRYFWPVLEPETPFVDGWPLHAMCEHLEAVTFGEVNRLLINVPPGFMKSLLTNVFWPAWEWSIGHTHYRYVAFSYSASLTERDNDRFRVLITSNVFRELYSKIALRNKTITKVMNTDTGWKLASSVGGVGTGERGDRVIIDDPHNVTESESEIERGNAIRWFRESISSRFNNLDTGALVIIMQRVHYDDVSGVALGPDFDYCHLCIPWEFDPERAMPNKIGWVDPRTDDDPEANAGEAAWPERFSDQAMARTKSEVGPYAWSSQYEQRPVPRGEGIFDRSWWQLWESPDNKFPVLEFVIASFDGAFTEKEENDPSALTIWGVFVDKENKRRIILIHAWRKRLKFSGPKLDYRPGESQAAYRQRTMPEWGLLEWVADSCNRFKVDKLLIEAAGPGISAAQALQSRYGNQQWGIQLVPVKGDKVARALAVQPTFSQGLVYAPDRDWAEMVIEEMETFPKGKHDDLTDSATQAIKYLRDVGLAQSDEEEHFTEQERVTHRPQRRALYPV